MTGTFKLVAVLAAAVGVLVYASKQVIKDLTVQVSGYGIPRISGTNVSVPVKLTFVNNTPITIAVDNLHVDFYLLLAGAWQKVAVVDQVLTILPGINQKLITPTIDLKSLFSSSLLQSVTTILSSNSVQLRTDVNVTKQGITFPTQSFTENIKLS